MSDDIDKVIRFRDKLIDITMDSFLLHAKAYSDGFQRQLHYGHPGFPHQFDYGYTDRFSPYGPRPPHAWRPPPPPPFAHRYDSGPPVRKGASRRIWRDKFKEKRRLDNRDGVGGSATASADHTTIAPVAAGRAAPAANTSDAEMRVD